MAEIKEFVVGAEMVTATMTLPDVWQQAHYGPPLTIGIYPGSTEIWIEGEIGRQNIPAEHLNAVIKQLRRAAKIAAENAKEQP
jgi:hypothetical protein